MPNILFLSDNEVFQNDLSQQIERTLPEEYKIYTEDSETTVFDIALLDGKEFLSAFREKHAKVPALILEPSDSNAFTENNLDTFLFKPLVLSALLNQIRSGINVFSNSVDGYLHFGDYELRPGEKEIINNKTQNISKLTEREVHIIQYLYKLGGKVADKADLLENVWGYNAAVSTHTIETHIYRLRKKVEQTKRDTQLISAEDGGYRLIL